MNQGIDDIKGKRILVLAPHPDDETLGCGGTICLARQSNAAVDVLFMTLGGRYSNPLDRKEEGIAACKILGASAHALHGEDGALYKQPEIADELKLFIGNNASYTPYDVIFCPRKDDDHKDHRFTYRYLVEALRTYPYDCSIWLYEVWGFMEPNRIVDISSTIGLKLQAIRCHKSQDRNLKFSQMVTAVSKQRGEMLMPHTVAEVFLVKTKKELLDA